MRNISADIFADEFFGTLSPIHRLLWLGLLLNSADDQGRLVDNVALMRSLLFPYDLDVTVKDIEKGLVIMQNKHKITRYIVGTNGSGKRLIQINNWWRYQKSAQWAGRSQFPAPPKWMDRIRMHSKGNIITLENWENEGGYVAPTKPLRSAKVEPAKPLGFSEVNIKDKGRGQRRAEGSVNLINGAPEKKPAPPLSPKNLGRGKAKGLANLKVS